VQDVRPWLDGKASREEAAVFAARTALRSAPVLLSLAGSKQGQDILLSAFRALAVSWIAARYPVHRRDLHVAAAQVAAHATNDAQIAAAARAAGAPNADDIHVYSANAASGIDAAARAAHAAAFATNDADTAHTTDAARANAYAAHNAALYAGTAPARANASAAARTDADALDRGINSSDLASQPLWPTRSLTWFENAWDRLKQHLLSSNQNWEVWTEWYEDRLHGRPANEALELARSTIPNEIWQQGPAVVNAHIKALIGDHAQDHSIHPSQSFDFFLSYNHEDKDFARWIMRLLENEGFSVSGFAENPQVFRNSAADDLTERQREFNQSGSAIALLSQAYIKSNYSQLEWSAAHNVRNRNVISFLIRPVPLFLSQVSHTTSLVGLSAEEVAAAIFRAGLARQIWTATASRRLQRKTL
jgi:hypothetical protein